MVCSSLDILIYLVIKSDEIHGFCRVGKLKKQMENMESRSHFLEHSNKYVNSYKTVTMQIEHYIVEKFLYCERGVIIPIFKKNMIVCLNIREYGKYRHHITVYFFKGN